MRPTDYTTRELINLYLEAVGLIIKLTNKLNYEGCHDAENHITAAEEFIAKNNLYKQIYEQRGAQ